MYRSLYTQLPCERCGRVRRVEIQFKTGQDRCERYDVGDRARDLEPGSAHEGCVRRFCHPCTYDYHLAESDAHHDVIAGLVESGRLAIADPCTGAPMTSAAVLRRGRFQAALLRRIALEHMRVDPDGWPAASQQLTWDGVPLDRSRFNNPEQFRFLVHCLGAVDQWMLDRGWRDGSDWLREDVTVWVDERGIIGFTIPEG
jgi:hypothetical protein